MALHNPLKQAQASTQCVFHLVRCQGYRDAGTAISFRKSPPKCATPFFSPPPQASFPQYLSSLRGEPGHEPPSTAVEPWRCQRGWVSRPPQPRPATLSSSHHPRHSSNSKPCRSCCSLGIGRSLRRRPAHLAPFTSRAPPLAVLPPRQLLQPRPRPLGTRRT